jgi:hypothetical protein
MMPVTDADRYQAQDVVRPLGSVNDTCLPQL